VSGTLKGSRHHSLVFAAGAGFAGGKDFRVWGHKAAHELRIFVVHEGNLFSAEKTRLLNISGDWNWHIVV